MAIFKVDTSSLKKLKKDMDKTIQKYKPNAQRIVEQLSSLAENTAKEKAPKRTSTLTRSINRTTENDGLRSLVGTDLEYSEYVEKGTGVFGERGRAIFPKNGQFMTFKIGGQWRRVRFVMGQRAQPYMEPAFVIVQRAAPRAINDLSEKIAKDLLG